MRQPVSFLAVLAFAFTLVSSGAAQASPAVPLVAPLANGPVGSGQLELVKKKKKAAEDSGESEDPSERGLFSYFKLAFNFDEELAPEVADQALVVWVVSALLGGLGANLWAPMVFFKDTPSNEAKKNATILGVVATILPFLTIFPGFFPFVFPGTYFLGAGLVAFLILEVCIWFSLLFLYPRMIQLAYSDAYKIGDDGSGGGGGGSKKKGKKKKKAESDDDE
jgi:hypothetical protein